jgi:hypothetical protein
MALRAHMDSGSGEESNFTYATHVASKLPVPGTSFILGKVGADIVATG